MARSKAPSRSMEQCLNKVAYAIVMPVTLALSVYSIAISFRDWSDNPIETTMDVMLTKDVPLPAVTVCSPGGSNMWC